MADKVLITGATGQVGSELVRQLLADGVSVKALVRDREKAEAILGDSVELVVGDMRDKQSLVSAFQRVSRAFLLTPAGPEQMALESEFVVIAKDHVNHVVRLSAVDADHKSPVPLLAMHAGCEKQLEDSPVAFTHLRAQSFMQNMFMFAGSIAGEGTFYLPMKDAEVSIVDVRDIASVAVKALTENGHENKTYDLTGPEAISYTTVAKVLSDAVGKTVTYVNVPPDMARKAMKSMGLSDWLVEGMLKLYGQISTGKSASVSKAVKQVTGNNPGTFETFAKDFATVFRSR